MYEIATFFFRKHKTLWRNYRNCYRKPFKLAQSKSYRYSFIFSTSCRTAGEVLFSWQLTTAGIRRFLNTLTRFSGYSKHYNKTMAEKQLWYFATWGSICASKAGASSHLQTLKSVNLTSAVIQKASTRGTKHFVLMHCLISCLRTLK